ncbi:MAG TPA: aldo/keto reductase, partial [Vicinamibacterales bacterium]
MGTGSTHRSLTPIGERRRALLKGVGALAVASAAAPSAASPLRQAPSGAGRHAPDVLRRSVPRAGITLPAIGLGSFMTFDRLPGADRAPLGEVLRRFLAAGGTVVDTSPLYGTSEVTVGQLAVAADATDRLFVADKLWVTGDFLTDQSHAERSLRQSLERLWRERIDLMQCHSLTNVDVAVPLMHAWKQEGHVRFVGVTHHEPAYYDALARWLERGNLDFVQVHYSIAVRDAETRVLPAAQAQGAGVLVNMPLEKGRLHRLVEGRPLPPFAREIGVNSWAAFFLKWILAHPAVTCVIPATSNPDHVAENMAALQGPLPDRAMRERMLRYMQSLPGFDAIATQG